MPDRPTTSYDRTVFFISDGTGITAETLGHSVLTQFENLRFRPQRLPFIDSADKAREAAVRINEAGARDGKRAVVISSIDNLLKGQSGTAMQNVNLMFGLDPRAGLERGPLYP